nr:class I SAM-dependent methyltransferase [Pseudomonas sp. Fl4BN1]
MVEVLVTARTLNLDDALYQYLLDVSLRETPLLRRLRDETQALPTARWQVAPEQGQFLALLVKLIGARRVLEVGTFTGYSALCMAQALPEGGSLICCDIPGDYNLTARRYWQEAGLSERIDLRLAPALETLASLERAGQLECFDLLFIDADKANYPAYLEAALRLLRVGGLAVFDNTLWSGRVLELASASDDTRAIQALNRALKDDPRIDLSLLPLGDGLTLCRKR